MKLSIDNLRKSLKKASFEDFAKELRRMKNKQNELEKILFKSNIRVGLFYVNVDQVKAICLEKLKEAVSVLYELLISKIGKENQKVGEDVVKFIKKMKTVPKDIDEFNELRIFARDTLEEELKNLNNRIARIMDRMQLLEEMNYKISFQDFA